MDKDWEKRLKDKTKTELIRIIEEVISERDARQRDIYKLREELAELELILEMRKGKAP